MLIILVCSIVVIVLGVYLAEKNFDDVAGFAVALGLIGLLLSFTTSSVSYLFHAMDLGVIRGQQAVIQVYSDRITRLDERLESFKYPGKPHISLDADSPIASIVEAISDAELQLAKAEEKKAKTRVTIEQRKAGPWSFIVSWRGEE